MGQWLAGVKGSAILAWFVTPAFSSSVFGRSRIVVSFLRPVRAFGLFKRVSSERIASCARVLLVLLVFAAMFSPRMYLGSIQWARVDLRGEDLIFPFLVLLSVILAAKKKFWPGIPETEKAFLWFLVAAEISIFLGLRERTMDRPFIGLLYLLKWAEYFLVFAVTCRLSADQHASDFLFKSFFALGIAVAVYGYGEYLFPAARANYPNYYRLFERFPFHGNANHVGGFLALWMLFFTGLLLRAGKPIEKLWVLLALIFVFFPFAWTYSRKSYFALGGALLVPFFFEGSRRKALILVSLLILIALLFPTRIVERLTDLSDTLTSTDPFHSSWAGNWLMWKEALWNFDRFFLFGSGLGSRNRLFYESQYVLVLTETGMVGFSLFVYLGLSLFRELVLALRRSLGPEGKGVALGWLCAFVGLLIHSISCVSWTVTKIAIPFWFLTALVFTRLRRCRPTLS